MHQDTHRIDTDTTTIPPGKKAGKRCLNCGTQIWLEINRKGRQPRFCTTACQKQIHAEIRQLRIEAVAHRMVGERDDRLDLIEMANKKNARADLLANSRTTWEQANG